jgi:probable F420-dependent oxidoreductase
MKVDAAIPPTSLTQVPELSQAAERLGFDALWSTETQHNPFLPLALVAEHSQQLKLGTAVAIGFARSPADLAYIAWELAESSQGRFILGLGTQVKAHIERRFGMPWPDSPVGKLGELIHAMRTIWAAWQSGERLNHRGEYFKLTLMTPFFSPAPIRHPDIPVYIAGVNIGLCRLAGEVADGFHSHPYHSARYLREVVLPAIEVGAKRQNRERAEIKLTVTAMTATNPGEREFIRSQISFYASTPSYRPVMDLHGWGDIADQLRTLSRKGEWEQMTALVSDEMLDTFAVVAEESQLPAALLERYGGLADRLMLYIPFIPGERDSLWTTLIQGLKSGS